MYCPNCGQQQASGLIRFCSRCGFPLEGTYQILANGGQMPIYAAESGTTEISPRKKGVKQGGLMLLLGVVVVPAVAILYGWTDIEVFGFFAALASVLLFVGGPLRMLYAAIFEEGAKYTMVPGRPYVPPVSHPAQMGNQARVGVLGPASTPPAPSWRPQSATGELVRPSVTEHTTRLLNKDTDRQD